MEYIGDIPPFLSKISLIHNINLTTLTSTLSPGEIQHACKYRPIPSTKTPSDNAGKHQTPEYRAEYNCGRTYAPSHNVAPTDVTPVLVSSAHFDTADVAERSAERTLVPMVWGMIPRWHRGEALKHGLTTNNCRLENLRTSTLYAPTLLAGQRCVIVCEGFYEWCTTNDKQTKSSERDVYYFYMPQLWENKPADVNGMAENIDPRGQQHRRLLYMAGLFDVWTSPVSGDTMFSYSVITFESEANFAWLHHRSPAILETDQQVADWLDYRRCNADDALRLLRPAEQLQHHQVSNAVNSSRNKSEKCNKPIELVAKAAPTKSTLMQTWLSGGRAEKRKRDEDNATDG